MFSGLVLGNKVLMSPVWDLGSFHSTLLSEMDLLLVAYS